MAMSHHEQDIQTKKNKQKAINTFYQLDHPEMSSTSSHKEEQKEGDP